MIIVQVAGGSEAVLVKPQSVKVPRPKGEDDES